MANPKSLADLRKKGKVIDPDVLVGNTAGWAPERGTRWGVETGRLSTDGVTVLGPAPVGRPKKGETPKTPRWWKKVPKRFLSQTEAAAIMKIKMMSLYHLRRNGGFIDHDVEVGTVYGWAPLRVITFSLQSRRITEEEAEAQTLVWHQ
ncbi:hypothetical protein [Streptomyces sp. TR02-1]|uniref:hypothetical protein n=1 Tax=Streptomyces sp. TR02-1 TaxID=3385977 RepID=UPI0039A22311